MSVFEVLMVVLAALQMVAGHSYHHGRCPHVPPMQNFDMNKFLGPWHVLEKTATSARCLLNEYSPGQLRQTMLFGIPGINHVVRYQGQLTVPDPDQPASMLAKFPLNVAGRSSYIVFDTDYKTYAGVYSCQKLTLWYRHSASILSRNGTLDSAIIQKLHRRLDEFGVSSRRLDTVQQNCQPFPEEGIEVNIRPEVFKRTNATEIISSARDVINNASDAAKDLYEVYKVVSKVAGDRKRRDTESDEEEPQPPVWLP